MGILDVFRRNSGGKEIQKDAIGTENVPYIGNLSMYMSYNNAIDYRGIEKSVIRTMANEIAQVPWLPFNWDYVERIYFNSDILRTVVQILMDETFGNGISVEPKFVKKCAKCGHELQEDGDFCPVCGSTEFILPNDVERERLEELLEDANLNHQQLIDVLRDLDHALNIFDNAFLVVRWKYFYDEDGNLKGKKFVETYAGDTRYFYLIMSSDGRPGLTQDGNNVVFVCPEHKSEVKLVPVKDLVEHPENIPRCEKCGRVMQKAVALYDDGNKKEYFISGEVRHIKKFTPGVGYGFPPILTLLKKILILIKQDWYILTAYHMQRPPRGLLILRANRDAVAKAFEAARSEAYKNPWNIVPLVVSGTEKVVGRRVVEWLDLSYKPDEVTFTAYRQEIRRVIASMWRISPIFQGEVNAGISNEGLQVTITNRAVMREQALMNKVLDWLVKQLGVRDWRIQLNPNEPMDVKGRLDRIQKRLMIAEKAQQLGYDFTLEQGGIDGVELKYKGSLNIGDRLRQDIKIWATKKGVKLNVDDFINVLNILPRSGLSFESFERLLELAAIVGGVENIIKTVEQSLNIPPLEEIIYRIRHPDAAYNQEQQEGGAQPVQEEAVEQPTNEGQGEEESPFDAWLKELEEEGLISNEEEEKEQNFTGEPEESGSKMYGEQKFGGQPEMNRENMPGMEHLYGRSEK